MAGFRKRPVLVQARQLTTSNAEELAAWIGTHGHTATVHPGAHADGPALVIATLEGAMRAMPGDWIVRGVAGEFYPCRPDIFTATYDPAPDTT